MKLTNIIIGLIAIGIGLLVIQTSQLVPNEVKSQTSATVKDELPANATTYICLQPYDDFTQEEAKKLIPKIKEGLNKVYKGNWTHIQVLKNKTIPEKAYYKPRNRYLADELLKDLACNKNQFYIIGLTHKDISYKIHGYDNYGIMGLTPLGKNYSIVSDFRTNDIVAVIVHEFGHGFYNANHCSSPNCIMCDYQRHKGKPFVFALCEFHKSSLICKNV